MMDSRNQLSPEGRDELLEKLADRFVKNMERHPDVRWTDVAQRLEAAPQKLWSLDQMELTGGEPDVAGYDAETGEYIFIDCSAESPKGRRSLCYDDEALESRKEHKPQGSAMELADEMGVEMLTEDQYRQLQQLGNFDCKTSSWLKTPESIRKRGGAIFGDRRFDHVFIYHNGAESYYAARGFRSLLRV